MSFEKVCFVNQISQIFILLSGAMLHVNYDIHNTYSKSLVIKLTVKQSRESVSQLYKKRHPTAKKIIKLFNASAGNDAERQSFDHLKRFVKSLEGKSLGLFLHFCTGCDIITCDSIQVSFTTMEGFVRRPVARTCVPILELPRSYESYPSLAEEFTSIMKENLAWIFDII